MIRIAVWSFVFGAIALIFVLGPFWPALVVAGFAVLILALAEIDEHMTGHRGYSGSFKRTDRMAKRP
jgi:hypothetical protein